MLTNKELDSYAAVLVWALHKSRSGKFKKYDSVLLRYDSAAEPLAVAVHARLTAEKLNVIIRPNPSEEMSKNFYTLADGAQLKFAPGGHADFHRGLNGLISIFAPQSLDYLKNVPSSKIVTSALAAKQYRKILDDREEQGLFGWTLCNYPTRAATKAAGITFKEYINQIKKACFLNEKNPVKKWTEASAEIEAVCKWLGSLNITSIHMESKNTDLRLTLGDKRKFLGGSGNNIPSFEIFTSPDYRGTNGVFYADLPAFRSGNICRGVRLEFKNGRVVKASAKEGADYLKKMIRMDLGAAQIGEFSLTDKKLSRIDKFTANTLYDENFGGKHGNSHIALGQSFSDIYTGDIKKLTPQIKKSLGLNQSSLHWDLINTEDKVVRATLRGGKAITIYENGSFTL